MLELTSGSYLVKLDNIVGFKNEKNGSEITLFLNPYMFMILPIGKTSTLGTPLRKVAYNILLGTFIYHQKSTTHALCFPPSLLYISMDNPL